MNQDILQGKWHQVKGSVKAQWGKLTNDELDRYAGETEKLVGRIQELYGESREKIVKRLDEIARESDGQAGRPHTEKAKGY